MSIEDTIGYQNDIPACVVCGKNVQGDRGFAKISHNGIMVNLCCPHCMETFEKTPPLTWRGLRRLRVIAP